MDSKTIRQGLIAFTLMERYLIHFEDNYRQTFTQAERQLRREADQNSGADQGKTGTFKNGSSPHKKVTGGGDASPKCNTGGGSNDLHPHSLPVFGRQNAGKQHQPPAPEIDLLCLCQPEEKQRARYKTPNNKEYDLHINP